MQLWVTTSEECLPLLAYRIAEDGFLRMASVKCSIAVGKSPAEKRDL
jgi:hypothetical protein